MNIKVITAVIAAAALGLGLSACGGSSGSAKVAVLAPSGGLSQEPVTTAVTTQTTTSTTAVATPKTGPLSKVPVVKIPAGAPPTTLKVSDLITGTGAAAKNGDTLNVNYVGELYSNGKTFDSSWKDTPGKTFSFTVGEGQVIKGWDQGLLGMKVGGRRELIIPASLGYGAQGSPPKIPKNATLVFVVDLVSISK